MALPVSFLLRCCLAANNKIDFLRIRRFSSGLAVVIVCSAQRVQPATRRRKVAWWLGRRPPLRRHRLLYVLHCPDNGRYQRTMLPLPHTRSVRSRWQGRAVRRCKWHCCGFCRCCRLLPEGPQFAPWCRRPEAVGGKQEPVEKPPVVHRPLRRQVAAQSRRRRRRRSLASSVLPLAAASRRGAQLHQEKSPSRRESVLLPPVVGCQEQCLPGAHEPRLHLYPPHFASRRPDTGYRRCCRYLAKPPKPPNRQLLAWRRHQPKGVSVQTAVPRKSRQTTSTRLQTIRYNHRRSRPRVRCRSRFYRRRRRRQWCGGEATRSVCWKVVGVLWRRESATMILPMLAVLLARSLGCCCAAAAALEKTIPLPPRRLLQGVDVVAGSARVHADAIPAPPPFSPDLRPPGLAFSPPARARSGS